MMMGLNMIVFILFFCFLMSLLSFISKQNHLLLMLLSVEMMMLSGYWLMVSLLGLMELDVYFSLIFMVLGVCEGALGLALLVMMVRGYGNAYLVGYNLLLC